MTHLKAQILLSYKIQGHRCCTNITVFPTSPCNLKRSSLEACSGGCHLSVRLSPHTTLPAGPHCPGPTLSPPTLLRSSCPGHSSPRVAAAQSTACSYRALLFSFKTRITIWNTVRLALLLFRCCQCLSSPLDGSSTRTERTISLTSLHPVPCLWHILERCSVTAARVDDATSFINHAGIDHLKLASLSAGPPFPSIIHLLLPSFIPNAPKKIHIKETKQSLV